MNHNFRYIKTNPERINQEDKPLATYSDAENNKRALKLFGNTLKFLLSIGFLYAIFTLPPPNNSKFVPSTEKLSGYLVETQNDRVTNLCDVYADGKLHCAR